MYTGAIGQVELVQVLTSREGATQGLSTDRQSNTLYQRAHTCLQGHAQTHTDIDTDAHMHTYIHASTHIRTVTPHK